MLLLHPKKALVQTVTLYHNGKHHCHLFYSNPCVPDNVSTIWNIGLNHHLYILNQRWMSTSLLTVCTLSIVAHLVLPPSAFLLAMEIHCIVSHVPHQLRLLWLSRLVTSKITHLYPALVVCPVSSSLAWGGDVHCTFYRGGGGVCVCGRDEGVFTTCCLVILCFYLSFSLFNWYYDPNCTLIWEQ